VRRGQSFRGAKGKLGVVAPLPSVTNQIPGLVFAVQCGWDTVSGSYRVLGDASFPGVPISAGGTPLDVRVKLPMQNGVDEKYLGGFVAPGLPTNLAVAGSLGHVYTTSNAVMPIAGVVPSAIGSISNVEGNWAVPASMGMGFNSFGDESTSGQVLWPMSSARAGSNDMGHSTSLPHMVVNATPGSTAAAIAYVPEQGVSTQGTTLTSGYTKAVAIVGVNNQQQKLSFAVPEVYYTPGTGPLPATTASNVVRGFTAGDGVSTQLCAANVDGNTILGSEGKAFKQESDGKMMSSMYGSNGSNSLNIGGDGSLAKIAQVADIASGVVSVVNSTTTPVLCQLVDGSGGSVAITNGLIGAYLADTTTNTPVKVNVRVVSGATIGELATTTLPAEDGGPSVALSTRFNASSRMITVVHTAKQFYAEMLAFSADKKDDEMKAWLCKPSAVSIEQLRLWRVKMDLTSAFLQPKEVCVDLYKHAISEVQGK